MSPVENSSSIEASKTAKEKIEPSRKSAVSNKVPKLVKEKSRIREEKQGSGKTQIASFLFSIFGIVWDRKPKSDESMAPKKMKDPDKSSDEKKGDDKTPIILGLLTLFGVLAVGFMQYGLPFISKPPVPENKRLQVAVLTNSGQPIKDAKVTVQYMQETPLVRATTSEGTCSFDLPGSVKNVFISVDKTAFQFYSREALVTDRLEEIRLQPIVDKPVEPNTNTAPGSNSGNGSSGRTVRVPTSLNSSQKKRGSGNSGITQKQTNTKKSVQVVGNNANIVIH